MKILLTGATGFVGGALLRTLKHEVIAATRKPAGMANSVAIGDIDENTNWQTALPGVEIIIHSAASVHMPGDKKNALEEFRKVNTNGTLNLARQAAEAGVKRFIFISSIKAMGEESLGKPLRADDPCAPTTPYGISKMEAERGLQAIAQETRMELVIIRPPMVYGNGAKGNFSAMLKLIKTRIPLPFGSIDSKHSFVGINNLIQLINISITHPAAANQIFLISDDNDLTIGNFIKNIARAHGYRALIIPFPQLLLKWLLNIIGKREMVQSIFSSLQVNIEKTKNLLGWKPSVNYSA